MVRISTNTIYDLGVKSVQQQTSDLVRLQQQLSTGRRVLTPEDDPIAASRVLEVSQSVSLNKQYDTNAGAASSALGLEENMLASVGTLIQNAHTVAVTAGNGILDHSNLVALATELRGYYQELVGLANANDGNGQYLFSGYQGSTLPFSEISPGNVVYNGDQGQRLLQISTSRQIPISDAGSDVFMQIKNGNGTFVTAAAAGNTGTGVVSGGVVLDPALWNSAANNKDFTVKFAVDSTVTPPVTTYDIVDNVSGNSMLTGAPAAAAGPYLRTYTSGSTISLKTVAPPDTSATPFDFGAELSVEGDPADGDTFSVKASTNESIFTTLDNLINTLENTGVPGDATKLTNDLNSALTNLDNDLNNVLTVRASVGARLKEIDSVKSTGEDLALQYQQTISGLQDLDYAKAISDLSQKKANLEAAQKSFLAVQGLSLFNYIQ